MIPLGRARVALALLGISLLLALTAVLALFVRANGITLSALALSTLPIVVALLCFAIPAASPRRRRWLGAAAAALVALDAAYIVARSATDPAGDPAVHFCEAGDCARRPPLVARVPDEQEAALSGLYLSSALGFVDDAELSTLEALFVHEYAELRASPRFAGLPNALLVGSSSGRVRHLEWVPPGKETAPCLVFLHGFGGQLSLYIKVLIESELGDEFVIVAPFLDNYGMWWTGDGEVVVRELVNRHLPRAADRRNTFLVGLSNGATGAARLIQRDGLRPLFRGAILLSGIAEPSGADLAGLDLLVITGSRDPRFPLESVESGAGALRSLGARVDLEALEGDHFIVLSHKRRVTELIRAWLAPRLR